MYVSVLSLHGCDLIVCCLLVSRVYRGSVFLLSLPPAVRIVCLTRDSRHFSLLSLHELLRSIQSPFSAFISWSCSCQSLDFKDESIQFYPGLPSLETFLHADLPMCMNVCLHVYVCPESIKDSLSRWFFFTDARAFTASLFISAFCCDLNGICVVSLES